MKNFNLEDAYPTLFRNFRTILPIVPLILIRDLTQQSVAFEFKKNDIITDGEQLSEYSYFIISGLIMCYTVHESTNLVRWIRSANDYAYSMDMFKHRFGYDPNLIRIRHEEINWLQDNSVEMGLIVNNLMMGHSVLEQDIPLIHALAPLARYKEMQQKVSYDFSRVPDVYLACYLDLTLAELKKVREQL
jgi:hypothetical protein